MKLIFPISRPVNSSAFFFKFFLASDCDQGILHQGSLNLPEEVGGICNRCRKLISVEWELNETWSKSKHLSDVCVNPDVQMERAGRDSRPKMSSCNVYWKQPVLFSGERQQCRSENSCRNPKAAGKRTHAAHVAATFFEDCVHLESSCMSTCSPGSLQSVCLRIGDSRPS